MQFKKTSIGDQVLQFMQRELAANRWEEWLPTERILSQELRVSRRSVRLAMEQLRRDGLIASQVGVGTRVIKAENRSKPREAAKPAEYTVGLLMPEPIDVLQPYQTLWIDRLKSLLFESGITLHSHAGHQFFQPGGGKALQRLLKQHTHRCWVLALSNTSVQRWFSEQQIPCVVAGMLHPEIDLPTVHLDMSALARHATGRLLAAGHRHVALLSETNPSPGALAAEAGFEREIGPLRIHGIQGEVFHLKPNPDVYMRLVERLLRSSHRPTGIFCVNPLAGATVLTTLTRHGIQLPKAMSFITTYGDPFMRYLSPAPTRYSYDPALFARKLEHMISQVVSGKTLKVRATRLTPDFVRGETLGRAPA